MDSAYLDAVGLSNDSGRFFVAAPALPGGQAPQNDKLKNSDVFPER